MNLNLNGKRALVCGASQGIGAAIAHEFAELGAQVVCLARSEDKLKNIVQALPGKGHSYLAVDIGDFSTLESLLKTEIKKAPFEILVNNSGGPKGGPLLEAKDDEFLTGLQQHILAASHLSRLIVPGMRERGYGRIVNIVSTSVKVPIQNLGVSNTIRGAMASWAKTLANELGPTGITVNNVLPGYTKTPRLESLSKAGAEKSGKSVDAVEQIWKDSTPLKRFAEPEEVAAAVAFLASPAAGFITGVSLPVDGGRIPSL